MKIPPAVPLGVILLAVLSLFPSTIYSAQPQLIDDRAITVQSEREARAKRQQLIQHVWGPAGFPKSRLPDRVLTNVPSPVKQLSQLARVDELQIDMAPGLQGLAYHFIAERPNGTLVVVHHGHACTLDDDPSPQDVGYGLQRTIHALLTNGFGVLGVFMPHLRPGDCTGGHDAMFRMTTTGSPMKYFLEPVAISLNHLKTQNRSSRFPRYRTFHMTGLSGGGWATTVYAAIDPTIQRSFPVAGTMPLYLRSGGSVGDLEQFEPSFYGMAGYPDLYVLGADARGRQQIQILVRRDNCCFGEAQHDAQARGKPYEAALREYEEQVKTALTNVRGRRGGDAFRVVIDETAPSHMISHHAIQQVILPALLGKPRPAHAP